MKSRIMYQGDNVAIIILFKTNFLHFEYTRLPYITTISDRSVHFDHIVSAKKQKIASSKQNNRNYGHMEAVPI